MTGILLTLIIPWLICFALDNGSDVSYGKRGGGGGGQPAAPTPPPAPPSPTETSREAISAQIEATPRILATQQEFGPQFTQQTLDELKQFGPQFAEEAIGLQEQFGGRLAEQTMAEQDILDPSRAAGSRAITEFIEGGGDELSASEIAQIEQDARGAASVRGLAESGFSGIDEISRKLNARQALKSRFLNVSLAAAGRLPAAGQSTVSQSPQAVSGQLIQNVNPSQIFGAQASNNQLAGSIFSTQGSIFGNQLANQPKGIGGQLIGGLAGSLVGGMGKAMSGGIVGALPGFGAGGMFS